MENYPRVLHVDCPSGSHRMERFGIGEFFGPIDVGLNSAKRHNGLNIGTDLRAGSIFPGPNRLVVNGFSPNRGSFYISTMGGAAKSRFAIPRGVYESLRES
ncbi:MAG: hypothetical protein AB2L13_01905 [Spirochaetota bacterium]